MEEHPVTADELCEAVPILKSTQVNITFEKAKKKSLNDIRLVIDKETLKKTALMRLSNQ